MHGWLPGLSAAGDRRPWAASLGSWLLGHWSSVQVLTLRMTRSSGLLLTSGMLGMDDHPCVWTDGSREDYPTGVFEVAGAGVYLPAPEEAFRDAVWGTVEEYGDAGLERCRAFMPVPGPLQTVQRAEFWGAILALQAFWPGHFRIDNLNVVRSIKSVAGPWLPL